MKFRSENLKGKELGRPRIRRKVNVKIVLKEVWFGAEGWVQVVRHRIQWRALANTAVNLLVS
jgi:hypothetical protein